MVNPELVHWIKSEEAKGYSEIALTKILTKQNYSAKDIREAFNSLKKDNHKTHFSISFALLLGIGFISLVLVTIVLLIASFLAGRVVGYFLLLLTGIGMGYYTDHIKNKLNATERLGAIFGIFSPTVSLILIITSLKILKTISKQLAALSAFGPSAREFSDIGIISATSMNPIIAGVLFYFSCNVFVVVSIIRNREYQTFLWYLLAPTLFFVLWLIIDLLTSLTIRIPV